jgi:hypothetical protein
MEKYLKYKQKYLFVRTGGSLPTPLFSHQDNVILNWANLPEKDTRYFNSLYKNFENCPGIISDMIYDSRRRLYVYTVIFTNVRKVVDDTLIGLTLTGLPENELKRIQNPQMPESRP